MQAKAPLPFQSFSVEQENIVLTIVNSILGSQQSFAWNVLLRSWLDPELGILRMVLKTYLSQNISSIDAVRTPSMQI